MADTEFNKKFNTCRDTEIPFGKGSMADTEFNKKLNTKDVLNTAGQITAKTSSVPKSPDKDDSMEFSSTKDGCPKERPNTAPSSQPNDDQAQSNNGKKILMQGQHNESANKNISTQNETHSGEADQKGQQTNTGVSIPRAKAHEHPLSVAKEKGDEGTDTRHPSFKDSGVQCGESQINEESNTHSYVVAVRRWWQLHWGIISLHDALSLTVAIVAIAIALYTQFISIPYSKQDKPVKFDPKDIDEVQEFIEKLSKRLSIVESRLQDDKQIARIKGLEESFRDLKDDITKRVEKKELEEQISKSEHYLLDQILAKVQEVINVLKDEFLKFKDEVGVKVDEIRDIKKEQKKLETNVMILEGKLGDQSQLVEKKNNEMAKEISQHKETLHGLNVSVVHLGSNVKHLAENITGISIETLVLDKRTEDMKENIFDKVSLIVVIMINTVLLVVVIIYLVAKRDNNRHFYQNIDVEEQQLNGGVNDNPASYSTAGRILSQVGVHRLERKLCVISFYEETHPLHMRMTQSVTQQLNIQSVDFIIRRHEDILNIPPVSIYFLFVDFNERNVILEDPTLGLGDLRLTTVQAVQKMRGRIVIFYVRDQNSKQLDPTKLYNEDLASVTRQHELSTLNRRSCFISAYDQLTDFQKTHLRKIVLDELEVR